MEYRLLSEEESADIQGRILYEDNHYIIFNKRTGEIVQGDKTGDEALCDTLKAFIAMRDSKPGKVFIGVPHRLDRPVSGIAVFAKTSKGLERLNDMFRNSLVHKTYWALVCKSPDIAPQEGANSGRADGEGWILLEDFLVRNEKQNKSYIVAKGSGKRDGGKIAGAGGDAAKLARLKYRIKGHSQRYTLVEVELLTGRHHQIRCQLAGAGLHIKGDLKYGAPRSNPDGGICLLARSIRFEHPTRHEEVFVEAPLPSSWPELDIEN